MSDKKYNKPQIQQYLDTLLKEINACQQYKLTKKVIIFTSLFQSPIHQQLFPNSSSNGSSKSITNTLPNLSFVSRQHDTSLINANNFFFPNPKDQQYFYQTINFMYLLTFYNHISIILLLNSNDLLNQNKQQLIKNFNTLGQLLVNSQQTQQILSQICFIVIGSNNKKNDQYLQQLNKFKSNQTLFSKIKVPFAQTMLLTVIEYKRIFIENQFQNRQLFIQEVQAKLPGFQTSPKMLTNLYAKILSQTQIKFLQQQVLDSEDSPITKYPQTLKVLSQALQNRLIFQQKKQQRINALKQQIYQKFPLKDLTTTNPTQQQSLPVKITNQFAIQAAFFIFLQMYKTQNQFTQEGGNDYLNYNKQSTNVRDDYFMNKSLMTQILINMFSHNTMYYNSQMLKIANFLQVYFQLFQNIPQLKVRQRQLQLLQCLRSKIIQNFIEFFYQSLNGILTQIVYNRHQQIRPKKLLRLTGSIKKLINLLKQMSTKPREPYLSISTQISQKNIYISSIYFLISWKCYQIYQKFWSKQQKNKFMIDIDKLCRQKKHLDYLQNHQKIKTINILKKVNQYFGNIAFLNRQYNLATKFFISSKLYHRLIETYQAWLDDIYITKQYQSKGILESIRKLSDLGLTQKCRIWCYKFMQVLQNHSQLIGILEDLVDQNKNDNQNLIQQINQLIYTQIILVDLSIMTQIGQNLQLQQWLPAFQQT